MMHPGSRSAATAVLERGDRNVSFEGSLKDSVIVTGDNVQLMLQLESPAGALLAQQVQMQISPVEKATPVDERIPPYPGHVGRRNETETLLNLVASASSVNLVGEPGVGKSYLLAFALSESPAGIMPDGIVYLPAKGAPFQDLIQTLFTSFYDCPAVLQNPQVRRYLKEKRALLVLDSLELPADEIQKLMSFVPNCTLVFATRGRAEGVLFRLEGLHGEDALEFLAQELGRPISTEEQEAAKALCARLGGHPTRIRWAVESLPKGVSLQQAGEMLTGQRILETGLPSLTPDEVKVLRMLAALGRAVVGLEHLDKLVAISDLRSVLDELERRQLVESHSPRYSITGSVPEELIARWDLESERETALRHFLAWAERNSRNYENLLRESSGIRFLFDWTLRTGRHADSIRLGRAVEAAFAWNRRWGTWASVLQGVLDSSRALGDKTAEGWALHQLGTRAYCMGETGLAVRQLREALRIRRKAGDAGGVEATRQNLRIVRPSKFPGVLGHLPLAPFVVLSLLIGVGVSAPLVWSLITDRVAPAATGSVEVAIRGEGVGVVTSGPGGISCPSSCRKSFEKGTEVTFVATASGGSVFEGWSGSCQGTNSCRVSIDHRHSVTATFVQATVPTPLVRVRFAGAGSGTVASSPTGIACRQECEAPFPVGTRIYLVASADQRSLFEGWSGGCTGIGPCQLLIQADTAVEASFAPFTGATQSVAVDLGGNGSGSVISNPAGIVCPGVCEAAFSQGMPVELTVSPAPGSIFFGWRDGCTGLAETCLVAADQDRKVTAEFRKGVSPNPPPSSPIVNPVPDGHVLTVEVQGPGNDPGVVKALNEPCSSSCEMEVAGGSTVTLQAIPSEGYNFAGWSGACSGQQLNCQLNATSDQTAIASFVPEIESASEVEAEVAVTGPGMLWGPNDQSCSEEQEVCTWLLPVDQESSITASPEIGYFLDAWEGECSQFSGQECLITAEDGDFPQLGAVFKYNLI